MKSNDVIKTTCPRDCYDACGIAVIRRNGAIAKVLGDPDHPVSRGALCGKCAIAYNGVWRDPGLRLSQPLKRVGPKGSNEFMPISWEQATAEIAQRLKQVIDAGQARSILHTHYTGTVGFLAGWFPMRFFNRIGATEVDPDTVCNKAGHAALELVFGNSLEGFDPRTVRDTKTILVWGANPSSSAPHHNKGWLGQAQAAGVKIIVVDPISHGTARQADLHLKLRPGSDAVLAFALLHVLQANGLLDHDFIAAHVEGAVELMPTIEAMSPAQAEQLCGVPAEQITAAALAYGSGPSLLWLGQGVQRQPQGGNIVRAVAALVAMSGQLGKPGAGYLYMNGPAIRGVDMASLTLASLAQNGTGSVSHMDLAATLEDAQATRVFFNWNNNPAASSPEQVRLRRALQREDLFHVAVELFHTDTTAYADIVLPAASFLECDDLILSYFDLSLSAQVKAGDPPRQALPNTEIFRRLAAAMELPEAALYETDAELLQQLLKQTSLAGSFSDLAKLGTVNLFEQTRIQFAGLKFATPSGRIELASARAVEQGLPRLPQAQADALPPEGSLRVLSPASNWLMNSSYGNDATIQSRLGVPTVLLHADDALRHGLRDGDPVLLANEQGELTLQVCISDDTQSGTVIVHKGRWSGVNGARYNVNALVPGRQCDIAQSTSVHGTQAWLRPVAAG